MSKREINGSIRESIILFGKSGELVNNLIIVIIGITVFVLKKEKNTSAFAFFSRFTKIRLRKNNREKKQSSASQIMQKKKHKDERRRGSVETKTVNFPELLEKNRILFSRSYVAGLLMVS